MIAQISSPARGGLILALVIAIVAIVYAMWPRFELGRDPEESSFVMGAAVILSIGIMALGFGAEVVRRGLEEPVAQIIAQSQGLGSLTLVTPAAVAVVALVWAADQRKREDPPPAVAGIAVGAALLLAMIIGVLVAAFRLLDPAL